MPDNWIIETHPLCLETRRYLPQVKTKWVATLLQEGAVEVARAEGISHLDSMLLA